jgi:toxin ParE1/3/4
MALTVYLTEDAVRDLEEIFEYVAAHDATRKAARVLERLERTILGLANAAERGVYPKELLALGLREYREVFFKPYRVIYRVLGKAVYVTLVADGRRDMQTLLQRRLLGA